MWEVPVPRLVVALDSSCLAACKGVGFVLQSTEQDLDLYCRIYLIPV